ncbi:M28 family metallopeptidase [Gemmatimonadota bacterium]
MAGAVCAAALFAGCTQAPYPELDAIAEEDLIRDVTALAHDAFLGREAGTVDELRAAAWVAQRAREAGLQPAGEDDSYWQYFPLRTTRVSAASRVEIGPLEFEIGRNLIVNSAVDVTVDGSLMWVGETPVDEIPEARVQGRPVAALLLPPARPPSPQVSLYESRYASSAVRERSRALLGLGASAVVLISDSISDIAFARSVGRPSQGRTRPDSEAGRVRQIGTPPVLWLGAASLPDVSQGQRIRATISSESFVYPSANIVAVVPGTDPELRDEYVLFSAHHDHLGVVAPVDGDSIINGADDSATACAALLAIGRAFSKNPGRRSALFVWHGTEEKGYGGSIWYSTNPTVPEGSIVAVLNADMIGRNHPDSAAILGMLPPHRNSLDLVEMALAANDQVAGFALDTLWDQPEHREGFFFRSDHRPYAQAGIPVLFYTSLLHSTYHTVEDETELLDFDKFLRITRWMYATGWAVAQADTRPRIDEGWTYSR